MQTSQIIRDHAVFRVVLQAMSRPGSVQQLPAGASELLLALLTSLLDNEVSIAPLNDAAASHVSAAMRTVGCRSAAPEQADFLLVQGGTTNGRLTELKRGTPQYPEAGATVIYLLERIAGDGGSTWLSGPGIRERVAPLLAGVPDDELRLLGEVNRYFPLGIDAMFLDRQGQLVCIPRSTRIGAD